MIGCAASHIRAWETLLQSQADAALVCEDDILVSADAPRTLRTALRHVPPDFHILYGGCFHCHPDGKRTLFGSLFQLLTAGRVGLPRTEVVTDDLYVPHLAIGTHCYVVSRSGAIELLRRFKGNVQYHLDVQINLHFKDLKVFAIREPVAHQSHELSSNTVQSHPVLLNSIATHFKEGGVPGNHIMTAPAGQVGGCVLNNWLLFCVITSFFAPTMVVIVFALAVTVPDLYLRTFSGQWHFPVTMCFSHLMGRYLRK